MALRRFLLAVPLLAFAMPGLAADLCSAKVLMAGKPVTLKNCAAAIYDGDGGVGVTLFITENALTAEEKAKFHLNSYAESSDSSGKSRTMVHFAFCAQPKPSPAGVKSVEVSVNHAAAMDAQRQWVAELPKDRYLTIEKLSGDVKTGGRLAGRITGKTQSQGDYAWEVDFDLTLPDRYAAAGPGCS